MSEALNVLWQAARDIYREYDGFKAGKAAARRRLGEQLISCHTATPKRMWSYKLDEFGIHRATAYRAMKDAGFTGRIEDASEQNPVYLSHGETDKPNANRNEGGDREQVGYQAEIEIEEGLEEFMGLDEEDEDGDAGMRGHGDAGMGDAVMTVPRVDGHYTAPVQLTLDAVYEAAQADLSRVERGMRGLLELVKVGDRAAAAKMRAVRMMIDAPILDDCSLSPPLTAAR